MQEAPSQQNRCWSNGNIFLFGLAGGTLAHVLAAQLVPLPISPDGEYPRELGMRLALVYVPLVAGWLAWLQRSWSRAAWGAVVSVAIAGGLALFIQADRFAQNLIIVPALVGGAVAACLGSNCSRWWRDFGGRLGMGLLSGLTAQAVYFLVLMLVNAALEPHSGQPLGTLTSFTRFVTWESPLAFGAQTGVLLILLRLAVGLTRLRVQVIDAPALPSALGIKSV